MRNPYPLQWPTGWTRTPADQRQHSRFFYGFAESLRSLLHELRLIGAANVVITSDLPQRNDGLPRAVAMRDVGDPGIAVWFHLHDQERVFACDRWMSPEENMRAIALSVAAVRGLARWGAGDVVARAFQGFDALPAGDDEPSYEACPDCSNGDDDAPWERTACRTCGGTGKNPTPAPERSAYWRDVLSAARTDDLATVRARHAYLVRMARQRHRALIRRAHPDAGGSTEHAASINAERDRREVDLARALAQAELELTRSPASPPCKTH